MHSEKFSGFRDSGWYLQSAADICAYAFDIPLQAFDIRAGQTLYVDSCARVPSFKAMFPTQQSFESHVAAVTSSTDGISTFLQHKEMWREVLDFERCGLWATDASYSNPLLRVMREHWGWLWWETLWFYNLLCAPKAKPDDSGVKLLTMPGFPGHNYSIGLVVLNELEIALIATPLFLSPEYSNANERPPSRDSLVADFASAISNAATTLLYDQRLLVRLAQGRSSIAAPDAFMRLTLVGRAIETLATVDMPAGISLSALQDLTMLTILLTQSSRSQSWSLRSKKTAVRIPNPPTTSNHLLATFVEKSAHLNTEVNIAVQQDDSAASIASIVQFETPLDARTKIALSLLNDRINTCRHAYILESFLTIRSWLNENFGELVTNPRKAALDEGKVSHLSRRLCRWASKLFGADICMLSRYDYKSSKLELVGFDTRDIENRPLWTEMAAHSLVWPRENEKDRQLSMSYLCADLNTTQFVPARRPIDDPRSNFQSPAGAPDIRCGISVPISFLGRSWGVISIFGFRDYQFTEKILQGLQEFSELLSSYYYYQWLLSCCQRLDVSGLNEADSDEKQYEQACAFLCDVLLVESATISVSETPETKKFETRGWINRPDLAKEIHIASRPTLEESVIKTIKSDFTRAKQKWIWHSMSLSGLALESGGGRIDDLRASRYHTWCQSAILSSQGEVEAIVTLLSRSSKVDNAQWRNISQIASNEVALFNRAVRSRADWTADQRHAIAHEMKQAVRSLSQLADDISALVDVRNLRTRAEQIQFARMRAQVRSAKDHLTATMESLTSNTGEDIADIIVKNDPVLSAASKIETPSKKAIDFYQYFNEIARPLQRDSANRAHFNYIGQRNGPYILVDRQVLNHIFRNLCSNAVKYSGPRAEILVKALDDGDHVTISFRNEGFALTPEEVDSIFDKTFRGSAAQAEKIEGEGLGLYYAKGVADLHGLRLGYSQYPGTSEGRSTHEFRVIISKELIRR